MAQAQENAFALDSILTQEIHDFLTHFQHTDDQLFLSAESLHDPASSEPILHEQFDMWFGDMFKPTQNPEVALAWTGM
jgi:tRNA U34 5-methylaminomethyl-2-thiouridine-forming methyltransferase MnmC